MDCLSRNSNSHSTKLALHCKSTVLSCTCFAAWERLATKLHKFKRLCGNIRTSYNIKCGKAWFLLEELSPFKFGGEGEDGEGIFTFSFPSLEGPKDTELLSGRLVVPSASGWVHNWSIAALDGAAPVRTSRGTQLQHPVGPVRGQCRDCKSLKSKLSQVVFYLGLLRLPRGWTAPEFKPHPPGHRKLAHNWRLQLQSGKWWRLFCLLRQHSSCNCQQGQWKTGHDPNMNIMNIHKLSWPRVLCTSSAWKRPKRLVAASITLLPSGAHARRRGNAPEGQEVSICSSLVWKMHSHGGGKQKSRHSATPELTRNETYIVE